MSVALPSPASAELEELQVHGQVRIRGNYVAPGFGAQDVNAGLNQTFGFNENKSADDFYNALAEVNFTADMSDDVTGYIALRSYDIWGGNPDSALVSVSDDDDSSGSNDNAFSDLRSVAEEGGLFTSRFAGNGNDAIGLYQAWIRADNIGGYPLSGTVGRQEIVLGREFLVGNNDAGVNFPGQAFDAIRFDYDNDESFRVAAFISKLLEFRSTEADADVDLNGVYATYYGLEQLDVDLYWIWMHNGIGNNVVGPAPPLGDEAEDIHTFGGRVYGSAMEDRLTYSVEAAYQTGEVNATPILGVTGTAGALGAPATSSLDVSAWAINALVGYTFTDVSYEPEVHVEYAYFSGDDDTSDNDYEQFTRLFSDVHYGKMNLGGDFDENMTNMHIIRVGGSAQATDTLSLHGDVLWFMLAEDNGPTATSAGAFVLGRRANESGDNVGVELDLWATYQYSEDLTLSGGWSHFFVDDAVESAFSSAANVNAADDDLDYLWWEAHLVF